MSRSFDGVDDYIQMGNVLTFSGVNTMTLACWVKTSSNNQHTFIGKHNSGTTTNGYRLGKAATTNKLFFRRYNSGSLGPDGATSISDNLWHHAAVIWNGTSIQLYLDGATDGSSSSVSTAPGVDTKSFEIGAESSGVTSLVGFMAHAHVYDRALSVNELKQIMRYPGSIQKQLLGYWPLGYASPEPDYSGNGNSGTVTGATVSTDNPPINGIFFPRRSELSYAAIAQAASGSFNASWARNSNSLIYQGAN